MDSADFATLPPEVISGQMYTGPGSGPMLAASAAWDALSAELHTAAAAYGAAIARLTESWHGPSSTAMAAAAGPYVAWISATAARAKETATRAAAAATAYENAFAATVPPPVIAENRSLLAALTATNVLGQNTAAIAAAEIQYAEMWLQNTAMLYGYAAASAAAAGGRPFIAPPETTGPAGPASQPATVANAAAASARGGAQAVLASGSQLAAGTDGAAGSSSVAALYEELFAATASLSKLSTFGNASMSVPNIGMVQFKTFFKPAISTVEIPTSALGAGLQSAPSALASGLVRGVSAGTAQANLVGRLSVPPAWASATPAIRLAATALPEAGLAAVAGADVSRGLLPPMALGSLAGGALGGAAPRVLDATAVRGGGTWNTDAKAGRAPVKLDRVVAQLQQRPDSVRHWSVDQAGLDDLIAELSKKPGVHAVHLSGGESKTTASQLS